ncbi:ribose 5-phosphate isomerase B [uncultured Desulfovibrio sp.]|uniref:ribose 5-phosphate isomerase B n=1 Tax=uncultured Desulfovibrio sp. TaxID=167968 RepID=UPI002634C069|nr:ribose 5-phosphate isomerase B [uncultured Desulfovibrio sp.]
MSLVHLASDHAGYALKDLLARELAVRGFTVRDHGTDSRESCDYPVFAHRLCSALLHEGGQGILVCGSGIGMSMAANRHDGIRAALCTTELHARLSRRHNDANVLCLGARITGEELALAIMAAFLETGFEGGRHQRRIDKITPRA